MHREGYKLVVAFVIAVFEFGRFGCGFAEKRTTPADACKMRIKTVRAGHPGPQNI